MFCLEATHVLYAWSTTHATAPSCREHADSPALVRRGRELTLPGESALPPPLCSEQSRASVNSHLWRKDTMGHNVSQGQPTVARVCFQHLTSREQMGRWPLNMRAPPPHLTGRWKKPTAGLKESSPMFRPHTPKKSFRSQPNLLML